VVEKLYETDTTLLQFLAVWWDAVNYSVSLNAVVHFSCIAPVLGKLLFKSNLLQLQVTC